MPLLTGAHSLYISNPSTDKCVLALSGSFVLYICLVHLFMSFLIAFLGFLERYEN